MQAKVGDKIRIIYMNEPYVGDKYSGKEGFVTHIDDEGQLHGTWGELAIVPEEDEFIIL